MSEKLIYYKYYKKFIFNNLLYTHFKSKSYRRKIVKSEKLSKEILYDLILMKKSFVIRKLKLIELINFFYFFERNVFSFLILFDRTFQFL